MKPISKKQAAINRALKLAYAAIDSEREPVCEGCGRSGIPLSHSHCISQKRLKYLHKEELISDKEGIFIECFADAQSCHQRTENHDIKGMLNYDKKMAYYKKHDEQTLIKVQLKDQR